MKKLVQKLHAIYNRLKALEYKKAVLKLVFMLPTKLPQGMIEFNIWADSIIRVYALPDNDSVRFALATMILHSKSTDAYVPKHYFGMSALKSASNQIAAGVMQDLKAKQAAEIEAAKAAEISAAAPVSGAV